MLKSLTRSRSQNLHADLSREDLDRVLYFAHRIHKLDLSAHSTTNLLRSGELLSKHTYDRLLTAFKKSTWPRTPFLPTLSELVIPLHYLGWQDLEGIEGLVWGPCISKLSIRNGSDGTGTSLGEDKLWQNVARLVSESEDRLTHFDVLLYGPYGVPFHWTTPVFTLIVQTLKTSAPSLTHLNLESLPLADINLIACLGTIFSLEVLTMNIALEYLADSDSNLRGHFSGLKVATIIVCAPDVISDLVRVWNATRLESLTIKRSDRSHCWFTDVIFQHLGQHLPARSLRSLIVCNTVDDGYWHPLNFKLLTSDTTSNTFESLAPLSGLEELLINLGGQVVLDDNSLLNVAKAFPNLRKFELHEREISVPSTISPRGIFAFTTALPRLQDLVLRFNGTGGFPGTADIIPHQLLTWDICTSDARHVEPLYSFIAYAFPCLRKLLWGWNYSDPREAYEINFEYEMDAHKTRAEQSLECWNDIFKRLRLGSAFGEGA